MISGDMFRPSKGKSVKGEGNPKAIGFCKSRILLEGQFTRDAWVFDMGLSENRVYSQL